MSAFVPTEKATSIRFPSTANFFIQSQDRIFYDDGTTTAGQFTIQKNNSLLNGFFTRMAPTEITLKWCVPNVYDVSGTGVAPFVQTGTYNPANVRIDISGGSITNVAIPVGLYTIAQALDTIVVKLNAASLGATFSIVQGADGTSVSLNSTVAYRFPVTGNSSLIARLGFARDPNGSVPRTTSQTIYNNTPIALTGIGSNPSTSLVLFDYLDFVSSQVTYNQELKDTATDKTVRDILFRWNLTQQPSPYPDKYGFPIYPTYAPFYERRPITFPKQIKWANNMPIGQLLFEVFATSSAAAHNSVLLNTQGYDWGMLLLVSEV
jgi:hypothetical protein